MIYVDIPAEDWIKKYPGLEIVERQCEGCRNTIKADKPFIMKDFAGLDMQLCPCGGQRLLGGSMVAISKEKIDFYNSIIQTLSE